MLVRSGRIEIHPRCVGLIRQLYTTVWSKARTDWERTGQDHGDLLDACIYLCRNVRWHRDPRPVKRGDPYLGQRKQTQTDALRGMYGQSKR